MTLGEEITRYRIENKISQRQFALNCGLSNGYIWMLENNRNTKTGLPMSPSMEAIKKVASAMGISLNELLLRIDDMEISFDVKSLEQIEPTLNVEDGLYREFCNLFEKVPDNIKYLILEDAIHQIQSFLKDQ